MNHSESGLVEGPLTLLGISIIVILFLALVSFIGTQKLKKIPGPLQNLLELVVGGLLGFIETIIGPGSRKYSPFIATFFIYILCLNVVGVVPFFRSPTSWLSMTVALALISFGYVQMQAILHNGFWNYLKHFWGEPWWLGPLMFPIHVIGELAKPLSLSIRLFGNIFGEDKIIIILAALSPAIISKYVRIIPIQFPMLAFAVFTSVIQALIFTVLTAGYLAVMISHEEEAHVSVGQH